MSNTLRLSDSQLPPEPELLLPAASEAGSGAVGDQFLRLRLVPNTTILMPVQQLAEVLTVAIAQIVPMPHMPAWVMGIYNWRGQILWMVDLGHLCGFTPWYQQSNRLSMHSATVLQVASSTTAAEMLLGLVVNRVEDIEWCEPSQIQPPPAATFAPITQFLRGYWWKSSTETLAVLDGKAILKAMPQP